MRHRIFSQQFGRAHRAVVVVMASLILLSACAAREGDEIGTPIFNGTTPDGVAVEPPRTTLPVPEVDAIRVPADYFSVQAAVDAAQPGDLVLLDPGVYSEEVRISTPDIVLRGRNRNTVFIDGLHSATNGVVVTAGGVAIENLTVRNYTRDAISVGGLDGEVAVDQFRAFHVTTSNTGRHGISSVGSSNVEITQVWASGHAGAAIHIARCTSCSTVVETSLSEFSDRGIELDGTNGGVTIVRSTARNNRVGVLVGDSNGATSHGVVIAGSVIVNNGFSNTPRTDGSDDSFFGTGVAVRGTVGTSMQSNRITGNTRSGILLTSNQFGVDPIGPSATQNLVEGHPEADIIAAYSQGVADSEFCIAENVGATFLPASLPSAAGCTDANAAAETMTWTSEVHVTIPYVNGPVPPEIDGMLTPDSDLPIPAGPVSPIDLVGVEVPAA